MRTVLAALVAALMLFAVPAAAQKVPQTATQFYMDYRVAFDKATSMDTLLPYMDKESRAQYDATPKDKRQPMFEIMKMMGAMTNTKVVKETKKGDGWVLDVTGVGADKKSAKGTIDVVMEGGAMKLKSESWKM